MKDARGELRDALYDRLTPALAYDVWFTVPNDAAYPIIHIGQLIANRHPAERSTKRLPGATFTAMIDIWDIFTENKTRGDQIVNDISEAITDQDTQTGMQPLQLENFIVANQIFANSQDIPNIDPEIHHWQLMYEFWVYEKQGG